MYAVRVFQGYALRALFVEEFVEGSRRWRFAGVVFAMKVIQPEPGADSEVRLRSMIRSNVFRAQDNRFRVGRMLFRGFRLRSRSGATTTLVIPDYYTPGYVKDAKAILEKLVDRLHACSVQDERGWKIAFKKHMDKLHDKRFDDDRNENVRWLRSCRRGWNTVHYPLPGYQMIRKYYLSSNVDKDVFVEDWAWQYYKKNCLASKMEHIINAFPKD